MHSNVLEKYNLCISKFYKVYKVPFQAQKAIHLFNDGLRARPLISPNKHTFDLNLAFNLVS